MTEADLKHELNARREVLRKLSRLRTWGEQIAMADAVLMATDPNATIASYVRDRITAHTPPDDLLMLDAALRLAEYGETCSMAFAHARGGDVPESLNGALHRQASLFDSAVASIDKFLSQPA